MIHIHLRVSFQVSPTWISHPPLICCWSHHSIPNTKPSTLTWTVNIGLKRARERGVVYPLILPDDMGPFILKMSKLFFCPIYILRWIARKIFVSTSSHRVVVVVVFNSFFSVIILIATTGCRQAESGALRSAPLFRSQKDVNNRCWCSWKKIFCLKGTPN